MKVSLIVVFVIMFFWSMSIAYGVELIETETDIIMSNAWMRVEISKAAGDIHTLGIKTAINVLPEGASAQFAFQDTSDIEYYQIDHGVVDSISIFDSTTYVGVHFFINFDDSTYIAHIIYTMYNQEFRWDVNLSMQDTGVRGSKIDFLLPVVAAMDHAFWTTDGAPFELGEPFLKKCQVVYRKWTILPAVTLYNVNSDIGISFVSPFDMKKPGLAYKLDIDSITDPFRISNYYLRLGGGINNPNIAQASVYFVPHDGCWRPGLAWMYSTYHEYFDPVCSSLLEGEGWYYQSHPTIIGDTMESVAARGVTWEQWHGYFPFYGYYAPDNLRGWSLIPNQDTVSYIDWLLNPVMDGYIYNSYDTNNIKIDAWWKDHNVQSYIYYQPCEAWYPFAEYEEGGFHYRDSTYFFSNDIARKKDSDAHGAWKFCRLLNPDTSGDWGQFSISQLEYLLEKHPDVHGIFLDRTDYWNYDYAHDDGITMIDTDTVYMYGFALEQINTIITSMVHALGKGIWANCPTSIEVCKALDGIMSEAVWQVPYQQYLGLTRPMILLLYDKIPHDTEAKLKLALSSGHFPSIIQWPDTTNPANVPTSLKLEKGYKPLFDLYKGKQWVLYPRALQLCDGVKGNIFSVEIGSQGNEWDYLISIVSDDKSQLIPECDSLPDPFYYDIWAEINIPDQNDFEYYYLLSGDVEGVQELDGDLGSHISVPAHMVSSLIHLAPEPRYEVTRLSSPVQVRGYPNSFEVKITNLGKKPKRYSGSLATPASWNLNNLPFDSTLGKGQWMIIKTDYVIPETQPLEKVTATRVIFSRPIRHVDFPTWVVDDVSFQVPELLFVKFEAGDTFPCKLVNNMPCDVEVNLAGEFVAGSGTIYFLDDDEPLQTIYLDSLARKDFLVVVEPDEETIGDTITISATIDELGEVITIRRPVETALFHNENDLFWDDFSRGMEKWDIIWGDWSIVDGTCKGSGSRHYAMTDHSTMFSDFLFQVNTKIEGSDSVNHFSSYMFFRVIDDLYNLYRFGIRTDWGGVNFYRRVDTTWTRMGRYDLYLQPNKWYNIRVEARGDSITAFLDGIEVVKIVDTNFSAGDIGIGVWEDHMTTYYDDVIVRSLE
jgi:hypothetical protein